MGMRQRASGGIPRALWMGLAATAVACVAQPAFAGYWTVPVDYYRLDQVRFPMAAPTAGEGVALNMAALLPYAPFDKADTFGLLAIDDPVRGSVTRYVPDNAPYVHYRAPYGREAANRRAASLSVWIKPRAPGQDMMLLSGGDLVAGYSLYRSGGKLTFLYWNSQAGTADWIQRVDSQGPLSDDVWHNIVIAQAGDDAPGGAYVGLYVDGVLAGQSAKAPRNSGLLGRRFGGPADGVVGAAAFSGWVQLNGPPGSYTRGLSSVGNFGGIASAATADIADFRYFGGQTLICSDKTAKDPIGANRALPIGKRCDIASDVTSFVQDRLEQASMLARLPLALEVGDHNFEGLNTANQAMACATCSQPRFEPDELRQSFAAFEANRVLYDARVGALSMSNLSPPYSLAFWLKISDEKFAGGPIYTAGSAAAAGLNVALSGNEVEAVAWPGPGPVRGLRSAYLAPGWHHVAVSYDGPPSAAPGLKAAAGLTLYVDGLRVNASDAPYISASSDQPVAIGAPDKVDGTRDGSGAAVYDAGFYGGLSEVQVFKAPMSLPQARALASRFPNAYAPVYDKLAYPQGTLDPDVPKQKGYAFQNVYPASPTPWATSRYTYDSLHLTFTMDWGKPNVPWIEPGENRISRDCQFMLGGMRYYRAPVEPAIAPASVMLCFSPEKIKTHQPAFALALYYEAYGKFLYLPIVEAMAPRSVLDRLSAYAAGKGAPGLSTEFNLNVGRYNMILQAATTQDGAKGPNYISPVYEGADLLITQAFSTSRAPRDFDTVTFIRPDTASAIDLHYVDQKQLMDEMDIKFSKDR